MPIRKAPDPPVVAMSARECPANDCPRVTVNSPTTAEVIGDDGPDGERDLHRPAAEEAGFEDVPEQMPHDHLTTPASSAWAATSSNPSGAATTRIRPCTRITSTCWPYRRERTSGWTTSSALPTATRPPAT